MTHLSTVKEMDGIHTTQEDEIREICETATKGIRALIRFDPENASVLTVFIDVLIDTFKIKAVEKAISKARKRLEETEDEA
jgi:hypothetical protein